MTKPEVRIKPETRMTNSGERHHRAGVRAVLPVVLLLGSAVLLFARLGHYSLWDDEAQTALNAEGILRTGDTSVVIGHNINVYRGGLLLSGLRDRFTAPLQAYVAAPFLYFFGRTALA